MLLLVSLWDRITKILGMTLSTLPKGRWIRGFGWAPKVEREIDLSFTLPDLVWGVYYLKSRKRRETERGGEEKRGQERKGGEGRVEEGEVEKRGEKSINEERKTVSKKRIRPPPFLQGWLMYQNFLQYGVQKVPNPKTSNFRVLKIGHKKTFLEKDCVSSS